MKDLIDELTTALQTPIAEIGERWRLVKYQRPMIRQADKPGVAIYPLTEDAQATTHNFDFLTERIAVEYWEQAARETETLLRDQPAAGRWLDLHTRFKEAIYSIHTIDAVQVWEARYEGTDFAVDDESAVRIFRLRLRLSRVSPEFG